MVHSAISFSFGGYMDWEEKYNHLKKNFDLLDKHNDVLYRVFHAARSLRDSGYDGEVFVNLHNVGLGPQTLKKGDKIAQAVLIPVVHFKAFEQTGDKPDLYDYYPITISNRGTGALGSTDKK